MGNPVAMFEITSTDGARGRQFYGELFGWRFQTEPSSPDYALIDTDAGEHALGGGLAQAEAAGPVILYVRVDDLDATLARISSLGGRTVVPPTVIGGGHGSFALFTDPDGTTMGLWA